MHINYKMNARFLLKVFIFILCTYLSCIHVHAPHTSLMPKEVRKSTSASLELESQTVESCLVPAEVPNPGPLQEQQIVLNL